MGAEIGKNMSFRPRPTAAPADVAGATNRLSHVLFAGLMHHGPRAAPTAPTGPPLGQEPYPGSKQSSAKAGKSSPLDYLMPVKRSTYRTLKEKKKATDQAHEALSTRLGEERDEYRRQNQELEAEIAERLAEIEVQEGRIGELRAGLDTLYEIINTPVADPEPGAAVDIADDDDEPGWLKDATGIAEADGRAIDAERERLANMQLRLAHCQSQLAELKEAAARRNLKLVGAEAKRLVALAKAQKSKASALASAARSEADRVAAEAAAAEARDAEDRAGEAEAALEAAEQRIVQFERATEDALARVREAEAERDRLKGELERELQRRAVPSQVLAEWAVFKRGRYGNLRSDLLAAIDDLLGPDNWSGSLLVSTYDLVDRKRDCRRW